MTGDACRHSGGSSGGPAYTGGERSIFNPKTDSVHTHWIRESWSPCEHYMYGTVILTDYSWEHFLFNNCDNVAGFSDMTAILKGGCQNPQDFYFWTNPWVNCRFGIGV